MVLTIIYIHYDLYNIKHNIKNALSKSITTLHARGARNFPSRGCEKISDRDASFRRQFPTATCI